MKQHDESKKGSFKSGGQRIDDHKFWAGGPSKNSVIATGFRNKEESSPEGAGTVKKYEDTTEAIKAGQVSGVNKIKGHPMKQPDYRN